MSHSRRFRPVLPLLLVASTACSLGHSQEIGSTSGRLTARPGITATVPLAGFSTLDIGGERDAVLYVPPAPKAGAVPLLVLLHGAGGSAAGFRNRLFRDVDSLPFALLIPDSRGPTWDAIRGSYGPDVAFIDSALKVVFARVNIDPARVVIGGFSDGASYALALGRINGDLFSRVVAFSPGFVPPGHAIGKPQIFVTHGDDDRILPFAATSARLVPVLRRAGYTVTLREFTGGHTVPAALAREAFDWAISAPARTP